MSIAVNVLPLEQLHLLSLAQCILAEQNQAKLPLTCSLTEQALLIDSDIQLSPLVTANKTSKNITVNLPTDVSLTGNSLTENTLELIVFSTINIKLLVKLLNHCHIKLLGLNKINQRNNQTSYRFNVSCEQQNQSRTTLAQFALRHKIEAALLDNAAKLSEPGLLVMDMDSTTIEIECIDEIAVLAGVGEEVSAVTELAMQGQLDFSQSLHQRVATLKDAPEQILADVAKNIPLMAGLETLVTELKKHQWRVAIASGGFTYFAEHLQQLLALDAVFANQLEIVDNKLTGKVLGEVVDAQAKATALLLLQQQYEISPSQTVAMGDGANDLIMMNAASLGIAFHAKAIVLEQADVSINHQGLDCMLHWLA